MKEAAQLGLVGMTSGTVLGYVFMMRSCGEQDVLSADFVPILLGALFIGLVFAVFLFLIGLARKDK
jgi:hypothetical protein